MLGGSIRVARIAGIPVEELMSEPVISIPSESTLEQAQQYFAVHRRYGPLPL